MRWSFASTPARGPDARHDDIPFVTHPVEVACLLHEAGYSDDVVAAGVLHDVLEDTDVEPRRPRASASARAWPDLVAAVSDDPSIEDDAGARRRYASRSRQAGE